MLQVQTPSPDFKSGTDLPGAVSKATGMQLHVVCVILPRAFPATLELAQDRECIHFGAQKAHRRTAILNGTRGPEVLGHVDCAPSRGHFCTHAFVGQVFRCKETRLWSQL